MFDNLLTEFPDLTDEEDCVSYVWLNIFDCGCLVQAGVCEVHNHDDSPSQVSYISKSEKKLYLNFHGPVKPIIKDGKLWVEGFIRADFCGRAFEDLMNSRDYYERFKVEVKNE